jgi:heptosyltransferase II
MPKNPGKMTERAESATVQKLLVLGPNWLGDAVMMTPLLDYLGCGKKYPDGSKPHITLGIRNSWAPLFQNDPRIDDLITFDRGGKHGGVRGLFAQAGLLGGRKFDAVIMCPPSLRVALVSRLAGIPRRIGFAADGRSLLLTTPLKKHSRGSLHYSQEMLALGQSWLGLDEGPLPVPCTTLQGCLNVVPHALGEGPPVWVMAPGTTYGQAKTWPARHVGAFLDKAVNQHHVRVLLLGDDQTRPFVDSLASLCTSSWRTNLEGPAAIIDMTGKTDLMQVVALLKSASAFVGNDSGLMHLAGALSVPTVGLFGSSNPDWTAPLGLRTKALAVPGFSCRPCYRKTCNQNEFCLDKLSANAVLESLSQLMQASL